jgi:hypothetical protein
VQPAHIASYPNDTLKIYCFKVFHLLAVSVCRHLFEKNEIVADDLHDIFRNQITDIVSLVADADEIEAISKNDLLGSLGSLVIMEGKII